MSNKSNKNEFSLRIVIFVIDMNFKIKYLFILIIVVASSIVLKMYSGALQADECIAAHTKNVIISDYLSEPESDLYLTLQKSINNVLNLHLAIRKSNNIGRHNHVFLKIGKIIDINLIIKEQKKIIKTIQKISDSEHRKLLDKLLI